MGSSSKKAILVLGNCSTSTKSKTWVVTAERLMFIVSEETPADTLVQNLVVHKIQHLLWVVGD